MDVKIDSFISEIEADEQRVLFYESYDFIKNLIPSVEGVLKWGIPFFVYKHKNLCYLNKQKKHGIIIGFPFGVDLVQRKLLVKRDAKEIRHILINQKSDLYKAEVAEIIIEAASII